MAGVHVSGVTLTTAGGQLMSQRVSAQVSLGAKPITDQDLSRAIQMALAQARFPGRRPIHMLPIAWNVDGQRGLRDPRGGFGRSLGLDLLVVSMGETAFATLSHCVELAHLSLEGVVAAPFASALAALEEDEMDLGAICIDMGGGSTSVAVFSGGSLLHVDSLAVGGHHVTADIARGLSTTIAGAERVKTMHGSAIASSNEDREMIEAPPRGDDPGAGPVIAPRSLLKGVIAPRVEETLELLRERLKASGCPHRRLDGRGADRRRLGADRRARVGGAGVRPPGASRPPPPRAASCRRRLRPRVLRRRRRAAPRRLRAARSLRRPRADHDPPEPGARKPVDPNAGVITRAAGWLRANL